MNPVMLKSDLLRELYWRDEIPEAMYWLQGEGLGPGIDLELLDRFLPIDAKVDCDSLDRLVECGLLRRGAGGYELTEAGFGHGARLFEDDFSEFERLAAEGPYACDCCKPAPMDGELAYSACGCGCCEGEPEEEPASRGHRRLRLLLGRA
jgi:hypothetical protein